MYSPVFLNESIRKSFSFNIATTILGISAVITLVVFVLNAIYGSYVISDIEISNCEYYLMLDNWKQFPIIDIKPTIDGELNGPCPEGFLKSNEYKWSGSNTCECKELIAPSIFERGVRILTVNSRRKPKMIEDQRWCIKKMKNDDSFLKNSQLIQRSGECDQDYFTCGSGNDINKKYCMKKNEENICPINSIVVSKDSPGINYKEFVIFNKEENLKLYFSREESNLLPISEVKISQENQCDSISNNFEPKILLRNYIDFQLDCRKHLIKFQELDIIFSNQYENQYEMALTIIIIISIQFLLVIGISLTELCFWICNPDSESEKSLILKNKDERKFVYMSIFNNYIIRTILIILGFVGQSNLVNFSKLFLDFHNCSNERMNQFFIFTNNLNEKIIFDYNVLIYTNFSFFFYDFFLYGLAFMYHKSTQFLNCTENIELNQIHNQN